MSKWGTVGKVVAATLVGGALLTGGLIYRLKPDWFQRVEPAVEQIMDNATEEKRQGVPTLGKYRCNINEQQRKRVKMSKVWYWHAPYSSKRYSLDIEVTDASSESVTLKSSESDFNTTLGFGRRVKEGTYSHITYQNTRIVFGAMPEGAMLVAFNDGRLSLSHDHWLSKVRSVGKIGMCKLVAPAITFIRGVFIRPCPGELYSEPLTSGDFRSDTDLRRLDPEKLARIATIPVGTLGGVCRDLKNSEVTDIFIPFRVDALPPDDESITPHCGYYGQLLYTSVGYHRQVSQKVRDAQEAGFDLVGSLIQVCKHVYGDTPVRFHAWFPVFQDPYGAQIQGVGGKLKFTSADGIDNLVDHAVAGVSDDPSYTSRLFADPRNPRVAAYELSVLVEIMGTYPDLDGINLDYIRYPEDVSVVDLPVNSKGKVIIETRPEACIRDPRVEEIQGKACNQIESRYLAKRVMWEVDGNKIDNFVMRVRRRFPEVILSADVFSSAGSRLGIGQLGVPPLVDWIMPMTYSYFGQGGSADTRRWIAELRSSFPSKRVVPCVRGWSRDWVRGSAGLITDLKLDIIAVRNADGNGYSLFTYESLLDYARTRGKGSTLTVLKSTIGY